MLALNQKAVRTIRPGNDERKQGNETSWYRFLLGATRPMANANHGHVLHATAHLYLRNPEYLELPRDGSRVGPEEPSR